MFPDLGFLVHDYYLEYAIKYTKLHGIVSLQYCSISNNTTFIHFVSFEGLKLFTKAKIMNKDRPRRSEGGRQARVSPKVACEGASFPHKAGGGEMPTV